MVPGLSLRPGVGVMFQGQPARPGGEERRDLPRFLEVWRTREIKEGTVSDLFLIGSPMSHQDHY